MVCEIRADGPLINRLLGLSIVILRAVIIAEAATGLGGMTLRGIIQASIYWQCMCDGSESRKPTQRVRVFRPYYCSMLNLINLMQIQDPFLYSRIAKNRISPRDLSGFVSQKCLPVRRRQFQGFATYEQIHWERQSMSYNPVHSRIRVPSNLLFCRSRLTCMARSQKERKVSKTISICQIWMFPRSEREHVWAGFIVFENMLIVCIPLIK